MWAEPGGGGERAGLRGMGQKPNCDWWNHVSGRGLGTGRSTIAIGAELKHGRGKSGAGPESWSRRGRGTVVGEAKRPGRVSELAGVEPSGWGRCWVAPGLGPRRRAALTAESARDARSLITNPTPTPARRPGAMSPGLLMLLGSAVWSSSASAAPSCTALTQPLRAHPRAAAAQVSGGRGWGLDGALESGDRGTASKLASGLGSNLATARSPWKRWPGEGRLVLGNKLLTAAATAARRPPRSAGPRQRDGSDNPVR